MIPAALATSAMNWGAGAVVLSTAATSLMGSLNSIFHGWNQVHLKDADMMAQIPAHVTIPPIVG